MVKMEGEDTQNTGALSSFLSELLLYHAALGRGYQSPFPVVRGLVYTSALPSQAMEAFMKAEVGFKSWHERETADDRAAVERWEKSPDAVNDVTGADTTRMKELKEQLNRRAEVTWKEDRMDKATLVEIIKDSYYNAVTYVDEIGARLAVAMQHGTRLAGDLSVLTLTKGTTDQAFIRSGNTGGAKIHTLTGTRSVFNFFGCAPESVLLKLAGKIRKSSSAQHVGGHAVLVMGQRGPFTGIKASLLQSIMERVYSRGVYGNEKQVRVIYGDSCAGDWANFLVWGLRDLVGEDPAPWMEEVALSAPAYPRTAVLFAARAALTWAFIETAERVHGPIDEVVLDHNHLAAAKHFARIIYCKPSGTEGRLKRQENLKDSRETRVTEPKLKVALLAMEEAIRDSTNNRVSRRQVRNEVDGATLSLVDELVRRGKLVELRGKEECQMGNTTQAYTWPSAAPGMDPEEAMDEFEDALEGYTEDPDVISDAEAQEAILSLQEKAAAIHSEHFLPVVPFSRMSNRELRALPKALELMPRSLLVRGEGTGTPEPPALLEDEDTPLDVEGRNLWVRCRPGSNEEFLKDWAAAGRLKLSEYFCDDTPPAVPA